MINELEIKLQEEQKAKEKAMQPYNKRIKNLKTAISNLKQFNTTADEMNEADKQEATKIQEL